MKKLLAISILFFAPQIALGFSYADNFDTYSTGALAGQGSWVGFGGSTPPTVATTHAYSAPNGVFTEYIGSGRVGVKSGSNFLNTGEISFKYYYEVTGGTGETVITGFCDWTSGTTCNEVSLQIMRTKNGAVKLGSHAMGSLAVGWNDMSTHLYTSGGNWCQYAVLNGVSTSNYCVASSSVAIDSFYIQSEGGWNMEGSLDNLSFFSDYTAPPSITIPAGGSGTDFSYWSGSFDVGNMSTSSTHWLPAIRWGVAASTSTATTTIANDAQLFYSGSTNFLIQKSANLETGITYWYQGRLYNTDFSSDVIATSSIEYFTITGPAPDGSDLDECGIGNLFGCLKNAFVWLLYPSEGLETSFDALIDTIQAKPPVGYFTIVSESITGLNASSTPTVEVIVPTQIKDVFFTPIDSSLGGLLWAIFAFLFYKRLKNIQL